MKKKEMWTEKEKIKVSSSNSSQCGLMVRLVLLAITAQHL